MPKITLENTAAGKGASLTDRIGQFDDNQAIGKLREISASLGSKGANGSLRIIYTTKGNKDLQFDARRTKWWGGLYTPSEARQQKNEQALRELFTKAGKQLSDSAKQELDNALDAFFQENSKAIKNLSPLINRFDQISQADAQSRLAPSLLAQDLPVQESTHVSQPDLHQQISLLKSEENPIQMSEDLRPQESPKPLQPNLSPKIPPQGNEENLHKQDFDQSFRSQDPIQTPPQDQNDFPDNHKQFVHPAERDSGEISQNFQSIRFSENHEDGHSYQDFAFPLEGDLFDQPDAQNFHDIDKRERLSSKDLSAEALEARKEIQKLLSSSLPDEIKALAKKTSDQNAAKMQQFNELHKRRESIQGRLQNPDTTASISDYLQDLDDLNVDIAKFRETSSGATNRNQIDELQAKLTEARSTLLKFRSSDSLFDELSTDFPELEQIDQLLNTLNEVASFKDFNYELDDQKPDLEQISKIYDKALKLISEFDNEISELSDRLPDSHSVESLRDKWNDLKSLTPHRDYGEKEFREDRQMLDQILKSILEIKEYNEPLATHSELLREQLLVAKQGFAQSLGESLDAGWNLLFSSEEEALAASEDKPDFASAFDQIYLLSAQIQASTNELNQILEARESMISQLENTLKESLALKEKNDLEIQDYENRKAAEQLKFQQDNALEHAKQQRIENIQKSLDNAFAQSEGIISQESNDAFKKLQLQSPDPFELKIDYIKQMMEAIKKDNIPSKIVSNLDTKLRNYLDKKVGENPSIDSKITQEFRKQISLKVQEWTERPFYSEKHKQALQGLLLGDWGRQLTSFASKELNEINQKKDSLQEKLNSLNRDLEIKQHQINSKIQDLDEKIESLLIEQQADQQKLFIAESQKNAIEQVVLAVDEILELPQEETEDAIFESAFENLKSKISEAEAGARSVDLVFNEIIQRLQDDSDDYSLATLKEEYSLREEDKRIEINSLREKISKDELDRKNTLQDKNQLSSDRNEFSAEQIELRNSILRLEKEKEFILQGMSEIGLQI